MAEYINKKTAISLIKQYGHDAIDGGRYSLDTVDDCIELENRIEALPVADVAPVVHGRWVHLGGDEWCCSACGFVITTDGSWDKPTKKYCEDCSAKMDEKETVYD